MSQKCHSSLRNNFVAGSNNRTATTCSECRSSTCQGSRSSGSRVISATRFALVTDSATHHLQTVCSDVPDTYRQKSIIYVQSRYCHCWHFFQIWTPASTNRYEPHTTRLKFGERCFSHAGPKAWNTLPADIQDLTFSRRTLYSKLVACRWSPKCKRWLGWIWIWIWTLANVDGFLKNQNSFTARFCNNSSSERILNFENSSTFAKVMP